MIRIEAYRIHNTFIFMERCKNESLDIDQKKVNWELDIKGNKIWAILKCFLVTIKNGS